ncbi:uncharacterized protein LOC121719942 isoform X2 [Alosa sapidissima]|uniref:uncharacterized protein LOC121719942 isoform X2 n=1 Tax=Alosa sapidissima TaxID=34773 RepID=UPI001C09FF53|nr:uncharacterized protein LOC121719942 isoform X2 [Alosa sapidissima]
MPLRRFRRMVGPMGGTDEVIYLVVLCLAWCVTGTQAAAQKKVQCVCSPQDGFNRYHISPPMADVVDEATDYCTTAWTCNTTECAHYDYEEPEKKDAMRFLPPVVNASFAAVDVESHVDSVVVTVDCPQKGFVAKDLPCPCEKSSPSTPSIPTNQDHKGDSQGAPERPPDNEDGDPLKTILPWVIFVAIFVTLFGSVAVVLLIKRCKKIPEPNGQQPEQQPQQQQEAFVLVPMNNPDESEVNIQPPADIDMHIDIQQS